MNRPPAVILVGERSVIVRLSFLNMSSFYTYFKKYNRFNLKTIKTNNVVCICLVAKLVVHPIKIIKHFTKEYFLVIID